MAPMAYRLGMVLTGIEADGTEHRVDAWTVLARLDKAEASIVIESKITRAVTRKLWEKQVKGATEHGYVMQAGDERVGALAEAQAEALDLMQYLEKAIAEGCCHDLDGCREMVKHDARD